MASTEKRDEWKKYRAKQLCAASCYKYDRARRERARQDGTCGKCFKRPAADGLLSCRVCIDRGAANNKARKLARKETTK